MGDGAVEYLESEKRGWNVYSDGFFAGFFWSQREKLQIVWWFLGKIAEKQKRFFTEAIFAANITISVSSLWREFPVL